MIAALAALAAAVVVLAVALRQTRARLRWEQREHAVTRAGLRDNHRAMDRCTCGAAHAHATGLPSPSDVHGSVIAALAAHPRTPWLVAATAPGAQWVPLLRVEPSGLRQLIFATRWGDA